MDQQQREDLAQKCDALCADLAALPEVPESLKMMGDVLSVTRFCLPALARCIRQGLFEYLDETSKR